MLRYAIMLQKENYMELLQLKYFCDAAKTQNFSETAKKFGVPASDISQSVRRLERELSVAFFNRNANSISLNDKGARFYQKVSEALEAINDAATELTDDPNYGKISISINTNRRIVMQVLEKFKRIYPNVDISATHFTSPYDGSCDLIIANDDKALKDYKRQKLLSEKIALAVSNDSRLAALDSVDISSLSGEAFISMNEKSSLNAITKQICRDHGFEPHIAVQSDDPFYVRKCIELGLGVAFVPTFSWQGQFSENIVLKSIEGYTRETFVYTHAKKYIPLCAELFLKMLIDECKMQTKGCKTQI